MKNAIPTAVRPTGVTIEMIAIQAATCFHGSMFTATPAVGQGRDSSNRASEEEGAITPGKGSTPCSSAASICAA